MSLYAIRALGRVEEYIEIDTDFSDIQEACKKSEMQFLSKEKISIGTMDSGGTEFPDLIVAGDVYLFSNIIIDQIRIDIEAYVYLKPIEIICDVIGKKELYWLALPPRIDCLDLDNSVIKYDWNFDLGIIPVLQCKKAVIDEQLTGSFKMFKIAGVDDDNIYVDDELMNKILSVEPDGIKFIASKEE